MSGTRGAGSRWRGGDVLSGAGDAATLLPRRVAAAVGGAAAVAVFSRGDDDDSAVALVLRVRGERGSLSQADGIGGVTSAGFASGAVDGEGGGDGAVDSKGGGDGAVDSKGGGDGAVGRGDANRRQDYAIDEAEEADVDAGDREGGGRRSEAGRGVAVGEGVRDKGSEECVYDCVMGCLLVCIV